MKKIYWLSSAFYQLLFLLVVFSTGYAQQAITTAGGTATGSGGSVVYAVGQVAYSTQTGAGGTVQQGVLGYAAVATVLTTKPTTQASNLVITQPFASTINVTWTNGNGSSRMVVAKQGGTVDQAPVDGVTYVASSSFSSGDDLSGGNYVVYNGAGNSVSVTDIQPGEVYEFFVFEYNGSAGSENYNISTATDNPKSNSISTILPEISSFAPSSGNIGATVTITGTNFDTNPTNNIVRFNGPQAGGTLATVTGTPTSTSIVTSVPAGATTGPITVEVGGQVAQSATDFTVLTSTPVSDLAVPYSSFGSAESNYRIVAVPLNLTANKVSDVFDELMPYDDTKWRMFHYQNGANQEMNGNSTISPGKGYWLIVKNSTSLSSGAGNTVEAPFSIPLVAGWNQIGNPYNFNISWADVQAANPGLPGLRKWINTMTDGTTLSKMEGGFVNATAAGTLIFPAIDAGGRTRSEDEHVRNTLDSPNWQVYLNVDQGELMNRIAGVGMNELANDDYDIFDGLSMPHFFDSYLEVNHKKALNNYFFSKDIVTTAQDHLYEFSLNTSGEEEVITFSWDNSYFGDNDKELYLWDVNLQRGINMRTTQQYVFNKNISSSFQVLFGSEDFVKEKSSVRELVLHKVWPNPAKSEVNVSFTLPETGQDQGVNIELVDLMGRKVWSSERMYSSGYHEVKWQRSKEEGTGIYLVTIKAGSIYKKTKLVLE